MPFSCAVAGCAHKSWKNNTLKYYSFPKDEKLRRKWIRALSLRRKNYKWKSSDRVCSAHFPGGHKYETNNIPSIFPRRDLKSGNIVWPVDISSLLRDNSCPTGEDKSKSTSTASVDSVKIATETVSVNAENFPPKSKPDDDNVVVQQGGDVKENQDCPCRHEINRLLEKIKSLEEQRKIERFGLNRFMLSDSDIRFYTGLPDYKTFLALHNFLKPRSGFQLNYYNGYTNVTKHPSYVVSRGRPRNLAEIDELFLTMNRLRLGLLEKDLADRFNTDQTEVSKIFSTWVDRMHDCLGQLSFLTDRDTMKRFLPSCFKPEHEDVYLIIDCTELFIEKSSQVIQQSATWSEYKGHNTGKALIGLSPIMLPAFVSEVYPGSISDEEILSESGILALAQRGDRWLADKGFIVQHILDDYGVRVDTPVKLEGKKQFTEEEDVHNRKNSQVRVHVERAIRRIKVFRILKGNVPIRYGHLLSKLWKVCCWLTAFLPPLINGEEEHEE